MRAQQRTRQWRQQAGLTQSQLAAKIAVSVATYRGWENGRDDHAGPTRAHAELLNRALRQLLPDSYADGEAFDAWGWPRQQDMSYDQLAGLLHFAGFTVPWPPPAARPPNQVFWPHKVRDPHLVHGVYALAAAAATRAGLSVHLLLDDVSLPERQRYKCQVLESSVRTWIAFASGDEAKLTVGRFSSVLSEELLADRIWRALGDYLGSHSSVLEFLLASKVVSPARYSADADRSLLELLQEESHRADRLLTPIRNWLVFEAEIGRMLGSNRQGTIITLGGDDERDLWEIWHRGCAEHLSARVQHMFLRAMPVPDHIDYWNIPALIPRTDRLKLATYLNNHAKSAGSDLIEWLLRSAVHLPAELSPGFREALDPAVRNVADLLRSSGGELSTAAVVGPVARAVVAWFAS